MTTKPRTDLAAALSRTNLPDTLPPVGAGLSSLLEKQVPGCLPEKVLSASPGTFKRSVKYALEELRLKRSRVLGRRVTTKGVDG